MTNLIKTLLSEVLDRKTQEVFSPSKITVTKKKGVHAEGEFISYDGRYLAMYIVEDRSPLYPAMLNKNQRHIMIIPVDNILEINIIQDKKGV